MRCSQNYSSELCHNNFCLILTVRTKLLEFYRLSPIRLSHHTVLENLQWKIDGLRPYQSEAHQQLYLYTNLCSSISSREIGCCVNNSTRTRTMSVAGLSTKTPESHNGIERWIKNIPLEVHRINKVVLDVCNQIYVLFFQND